MKPLFARVLLERPKEEKIGSVYVPDDSQRRMAKTKGRVLDVGPTCNPEIKNLVGHDVLIGRHSGDWINIDGTPGLPDDGTKEFFIVQEEDILCALVDELDFEERDDRGREAA